MNIERVMIAPTTKQAKEFAKWIAHQGDARGLIIEEWDAETRRYSEPYLIAFDSYGATHETVIREFKLRNTVQDTIIWHKDGNMLSEHRHGSKVRTCDLPEGIKAFMYLVAQELSNSDPRFLNE